MSLKQRINDDLKAALKSGDGAQKNALRQMLAGIRQAELDKRATMARQMSPGDKLTEAELAELEQTSIDDAAVLEVVQREAKARREAIHDAQRAGRSDLVPGYERELAAIERYLPRQLTREELETLAREAIAEVGATDPKHMGAVMKLLGPRTRGLADGRFVSDVVREMLARK
jgi:uncharacterized protein